MFLPLIGCSRSAEMLWVFFFFQFDSELLKHSLSVGAPLWSGGMIWRQQCHAVWRQSLQTRMMTGQSLWDTFEFGPSPPAAPRSLKVTFVAFLVSDAQRYKVMLLVEAPHPGSGLVRLDKGVHTGCGCFLHSHTFPVSNCYLPALFRVPD